MFIEDIHTEFRMLIDKSYNGSFPEMETQEIDNILNYSIYQYIHNRYGINNIYQKGFEQSQKRVDDLRYLLKTCYFSGGTSYTEDGIKYSTIDLKSPYKESTLSNALLNTKYLHFVKIEAQVTIAVNNNCGTPVNKTGQPRVKVISQEEWVKVKDDPFDKPKPSTMVANFDSNGVELKSVPCTVNWVKVSFIKEPTVVKYVEDYETIDNTGTLEFNTLYEVIEGTITYNTKTYKAGDVFETNSTISVITGTGLVRLFTGIEFPDYVIKEIIKLAVTNELELLESPRQVSSANNNMKIE
jgi:hypothetical protein